MAIFSSRLLHSHSSSSSSTSVASSEKSEKSDTNAPFILSVNLESPPIILYGQPNESTGSLLSGMLSLTIKSPPDRNNDLRSVKSSDPRTARNNDLRSIRSNDLQAVRSSSSVNTKEKSPDVEMTSVTLSLTQIVTYQKPFLPPSTTISSCPTCKKSVTELARWDVLTAKSIFQPGKHAYPFSHLLPGSLPATSYLGASTTTSIRYELVAKAKSTSNNVNVVLPLTIARSILRGPDRNSLRVFPPTDVTATAVLPNVIYPKSSFPIELKLDNITSDERRWRMRKLTWRIEETVKIRAFSCDKHILKLRVLEEHTKRTNALKIAPKDKNLPAGVTTNISMTDSPTVAAPANNANDGSPAQHPSADIEPSVSNSTLNNDIANDLLSPVSSYSENRAGAGSPGLGSQSSTPTQTPVIPPKKTAMYLEEIRVVNNGEIKDGWKSDFSGKGRIELVAEISAVNLSTGISTRVNSISSDNPKVPEFSEGANFACDIDDPTVGIHVSHMLIVEVVVAEEYLQSNIPQNHMQRHNGGSVRSASRSRSKTRNDNADLAPVTSNGSVNGDRSSEMSPGLGGHIKSPATASNQSTVGVPTGAARVLRMQFKLIVTERSGLGISWDDEVPPTYEAVRTLSPPTYDTSVSGSSTPNTPYSHVRTPGVLYGIGSTPGVNPRSAPPSIDNIVDLDDRIQEFSL